MNLKNLFILLSLFFISLFIPAVSKAAVSDWQKSASINPTSQTDFSSETFKQSVSKLAATGANYVTLIIPYYQSSLDSATIYRGWNTPTDQSVIDAIQYAHSLGLKVMLKPHIDVETGDWRAHINPSDRDGWFASYGTILNRYADMANTYGAEEISVGAELYRMAAETQNYNNTARWNTLISDVRSRFSGFLTYSANHGGPAERNEIKFWNLLDYIGVSAYFALAADQLNPTVEALKNAWENINAQELLPLYQAWNKPMLFTEVGYKSVDGANTEPWAWWRSGPVDQQGQADNYEALFSYWNGQPYFKGVHLWDWKSVPNPSGVETDYTPQNKLAENTMKQWFGGSGNPQPSPSVSPSPTTTPVPGQSQYQVSGSFSPSQPVVSSAAQAQTQIQTTQPQNGIIVDMEIYNEQNQKIHQQFFSGQSWNANHLTTYNTSWIPATPGLYTLRLGLFTADWASNFYWNNNVAQTTVASPSTPSVTPTTTPLPTVTTSPSPTSSPSPTANPAPSVTATPTPSPSTPNPSPTATPQSTTIEVWWPTQDARLSGTQPFKALLKDADIGAYTMRWQVDGGQTNSMGTSQQDHPHYESLVDVGGWSWRENGPYVITFKAYDNSGNEIASTTRSIYINR